MITDPFIISLAANIATLLLTLGLNKIKDNTTLSDALSTCLIDIEDQDVRQAINELLLAGGQELQAIVNADIKTNFANALIQNVEIKPGLTGKDRCDYFNGIINNYFDKLCEQIIKNEQYFRKLTIEYEMSIKADTQYTKTIVEKNYEATQDIQTQLAEIKALVSINAAKQNKENTATIPEYIDKYLSSLYDQAKYCEKHNDNETIKDITENKYLREPEAPKHRSYASMLNNLGKAYYEEDNIEKALIYVKKAFDVKPKDPIYSLNMANLYAFNDDYEEADKILATLPETEDTKVKADIKNVQALIAAYKNDINKTLELLDEALILVPDDDIYIMNKGYFLCRKGEYPDGLKLLRQVFNKHKGKIIYLKSLAFCLLQYHISVNTLRKGTSVDGYTTFYFKKTDGCKLEIDITEELKEACLLYDKIIEIKGCGIDDKTLVNSSVCFMQNGDLQKALELNKRVNNPDSEYYRNALKNRGIIWACLENNDEAFKCFKEYADKYPDEADSYMHLGQAYLHNKMFEEALDCFQKANEINKDEPYIIANMAAALGLMGSFKAALAKIDLAIEKGLQDSNIYFNKGISEYNLEMYGNARLSFLKSKELDNKKDREKELLYSLSACAEKTNDIDEAILYMNELRVIEPSNNEYDYQYAVLLFNKGRYSESGSICKKILTAKITEKLRINTIKLLNGIEVKTKKIVIP